MDASVNLSRFLETMTRERGVREDAPWTGGLHPFVTISRQTGAGGHTLARAILDELQKAPHVALFRGWQTFDQEICRKVAGDPRLHVSLRALLNKECRTEIEDVIAGLVAGETPQSQVLREIFRTIYSLAAVGKVVLVGRGAGCLTRDLPLGVHVRLVAPFSVRLRRMRDYLRLTESRTAVLVAEQDKARARLIKTYFGRDIDDPLLYDAVWNTDSVSVPVIASTVVRLVQARMKERSAPPPAAAVLGGDAAPREDRL